MSVADTLAIVMALSVQPGAGNYGDIPLPPPAPQVTIAGQPGGAVSTHAARIIDYENAGTRVRLMGSCVSACTLVLALPRDRICVGPNAALGFHQPTPRNNPRIATTDLGAAMVETYPAFVQQWLKANYNGLPAGTPRFLRYDVLKRYYPTCS